MSDRSYIESSFPVKEASLESVREKNIRHGHISTLHIWWANREESSNPLLEDEKKWGNWVLEEARKELKQFYPKGGSDFFISAIGLAMEAFGRYKTVEKISGEKVNAEELLKFIRKVVSIYALSRILKSSEPGGIDEETRFYILWRWTYNSLKVSFDDARKLGFLYGKDNYSKTSGEEAQLRLSFDNKDA